LRKQPTLAIFTENKDQMSEEKQNQRKRKPKTSMPKMATPIGFDELLKLAIAYNPTKTKG